MVSFLIRDDFMNEKVLVLFIYETLFLNDICNIHSDREYQIEYYFNEQLLDPITIEYLNHFLIDRYEENKELLSVIFNIPLLEEFINKKYNILDIKILSKLLSKYRGKEKYLELVTSVPKEIDSKLNKLALNFINYYNEALELSYQEPNPYQKVLQ